MPKVIAVQFGLGVILAAAMWGILGNVSGYSALLGCVVAVLPNGFLALRLSIPRRDPGARPLIRAAYVGEIGKVALTVLLCSIVFVMVRPLAAGPFFAAFIVTVLAPLAGLLDRDKTEMRQDTVDKHGE
ncbi:MAG: ATP synthase subunit I [Woeseiaceae bacterium]